MRTLSRFAVPQHDSARPCTRFGRHVQSQVGHRSQVTSQVPAAFFENQRVRKSLIQVTLEANQPVRPRWPFASITWCAVDGANIDRLMQDPIRTRASDLPR